MIILQAKEKNTFLISLSLLYCCLQYWIYDSFHFLFIFKTLNSKIKDTSSQVRRTAKISAKNKV